MLEISFIERDDIGVTAFVFGVAVGALPAFRLPVQAVKALPGLAIGRDVFVTVCTQFALLGALKRHMARLALGLNFNVTLNDLARHDQRLKLSVCVGVGKQREH